MHSAPGCGGVPRRYVSGSLNHTTSRPDHTTCRPSWCTRRAAATLRHVCTLEGGGGLLPTGRRLTTPARTRRAPTRLAAGGPAATAVGAPFQRQEHCAQAVHGVCTAPACPSLSARLCCACRALAPRPTQSASYPSPAAPAALALCERALQRCVLQVQADGPPPPQKTCTAFPQDV